MTMATVAAAPKRSPRRRAGGALGALTRRALRDARTRTLGFVYLFAAVAYIQPVAYRHTYPTLADRLHFAQSFAHNEAVVLFYGKAHDLLTVGGYSAWRVGGTLSVFAAVFGLLAAVRALRTEEDAGRTDLVLACRVSRRTAYTASMLAILTAILGLGLAALAGLAVGGLPVGGSAYLVLTVVSVMPVFVGVGALVSQLAPTRRMALELGSAVVALAFLLRLVADTSAGTAWVRWLTPLGWAEALRPFSGAQPLVLLLPLLVSGGLISGAGMIALHRDVGSGLLAAHDSRPPRLRLLSSPMAQSLRGEGLGLAVWLASIGGFAFVVGVVSKSVTSLGISRALQRALAKLGAGSALTPRAYIGFSFSFFLLAVSLLAVSEITAAWHEEDGGRLETVLAKPVSRCRWLGGRLGLGAGALCTAALAAAACAWAGAVSQGVSLPLGAMLEAGLNLLPVGLLFLGLAALVYAVLPRPSPGIAYGVVIVSFLWQLFSKLLGAPGWLVSATPFAHVGLVPAQSFQAGAAAVLASIGALAALAAAAVFRRRDLVAG